MARRISLEPHLTIEELEGSNWGTTDPVERSRWHFLLLLARGLTAKLVASITGYSHGLRNETHIQPQVLHQLVQRSRFFWQGIRKISALW